MKIGINIINNRLFKILVFFFFLIFSLSSCSILERRANRTYTIHFNANGGTGQMDDLFVEKGKDGYLPECEFVKEGYECWAWSLDKDGNDCYGYIPNLSLHLPSSVKNGDAVEIYAIWTTSGFDFKIESMGFFVSAKITKYSGNAKEVIIPSYFSGRFSSGIASCDVSSISSGVFEGHTEIQTIKNLPIRDIYSKVFYGCTSLKNIETAENIKINSIGDQAFYNCSSLLALQLGETRIIGQEAFYMCTSLNKIVIPRLVESIGDSAFYGWNENQTIEFSGHSENVFGEEWLNGCNAKIIWAN